MKRLVFVVILVLTLGGYAFADAALIDNGGGLIYDTDLDITWYDYNPGFLTGYQAASWVAGLNVGGITGWRLPKALPVNGSTYNLPRSYDGSTDYGYNITSPNSEMAHLFYVSLANKGYYDVNGAYPQPGWGFVNRGPFVNIEPVYGKQYWTGNTYGVSTAPIVFDLLYGMQSNDDISVTNSSLAVHSGNVGSSPQLEVSPTSEKNFGGIEVGSYGTPLEFTIRNTGNADLNVNEISVSDFDNFTLNWEDGSNPCLSSTPTIAPGDSCTVIVNFYPQTAGDKSGRFTVIANYPANTMRVDVQLTGIGNGFWTYPIDGLKYSSCPVDEGTAYDPNNAATSYTVVWTGKYSGNSTIRCEGSGGHPGVDIRAATTQSRQTVAIGDGTVIERNYRNGLGNYVIVEHSAPGIGTFYSNYLHLASINSLVQEGQGVNKGQEIGIMGNTGGNWGVHLHFQIDKALHAGATNKKGVVLYYKPYWPTYTNAKRKPVAYPTGNDSSLTAGQLQEAAANVRDNTHNPIRLIDYLNTNYDPTTTFFEESFATTTLDGSKWDTALAESSLRWCGEAPPNHRTSGEWLETSIQSCHGYTQIPVSGSVTIAGGAVNLDSGVSRAFPLLWSGPPTHPSRFPTEGDFVMEVRMRYDTVSPNGDGLRVFDWAGGSSIDTFNPYSNGVLEIWASSGTGLRVSILDGAPVSIINPTDFHTYRLEYSSGAYTLLVDGIQVLEPLSSSRRPNGFWIGSPGFVSWTLSEWSSISIDYISVSSR